LDIKPGSCPNSFNPGSNGVLPVALVVTDEFDASEVDISTLVLSRADGYGGTITPHEGPPGPHTVLEDVASLFDGEPCDCHELEGDGVMDVSMKFKTQDMVDALNLIPGTGPKELVLDGNLLDGRPFRASDCIRFVPPMVPGTGLTIINVESNIPEAWVVVEPLDLTDDGGGFANFYRAFDNGETVTFTADATHNFKVFRQWFIDGVGQPVGQLSIQVPTNGGQRTVRAKYVTPFKPGDTGGTWDGGEVGDLQR
jgi:hypothetical protein